MTNTAPTARTLAVMADNLADVGGRDRIRHHWGVIGISRAQWTLLAAALSLGGSIRVGLEDNLYLPDGTMATSNGDLIMETEAAISAADAAAGEERVKALDLLASPDLVKLIFDSAICK